MTLMATNDFATQKRVPTATSRRVALLAARPASRENCQGFGLLAGLGTSPARGLRFWGDGCHKLNQVLHLATSQILVC